MIESIFAFIFGSCIGSFLNVCIHRLPKDQSIVKPRSYCPKCAKPIKWYDNVPIISYIVLRARCRNCRDKISIRYPIIELLTALSFLVLYNQLGLSFEFAKYIFLFCLLITVSFIDIDYHAIPVHLCFIGIVVGLAFAVIPTLNMIEKGVFNLDSLPLVVAFRNLIFAFGFTYLFKFFGDILLDFYLKFRKKESIEGETESLGLGDVDFMGMVGVFLGLKSAVLVFFIAPFLAVIYSLIALIFKKSHLIPYLPYLSLAAIIVYFWGDKILALVF